MERVCALTRSLNRGGSISDLAILGPGELLEASQLRTERAHLGGGDLDMARLCISKLRSVAEAFGLDGACAALGQELRGLEALRRASPSPTVLVLAQDEYRVLTVHRALGELERALQPLVGACVARSCGHGAEGEAGPGAGGGEAVIAAKVGAATRDAPAMFKHLRGCAACGEGLKQFGGHLGGGVPGGGHAANVCVFLV